MAATQEQLMKEIEGLKKFQSIKYCLLFVLFILIFGFVFEGLVAMLLDKTSFAIYLNSYRWQKLVWMSTWWAGFLMLGRRYQQKVIRKKEAALQKFQVSI
jgi:hypothetical protein